MKDPTTWLALGGALLLFLAGMYLLFGDRLHRRGSWQPVDPADAADRPDSRPDTRTAAPAARPARRRRRRGRDEPIERRDSVAAHPTGAAASAPLAPMPQLKRAGVIINPTKFDDLAGVRTRLNQTCVRLGWAAPLIFLTTADDPGFGQTRRALDQHVDVVCPLGGDGTVRAVAEVLAGKGVPMGLLPAGTGNLLARNLDLPLDDLEKALEVALTGRNKMIDVAWLSGETQTAYGPAPIGVGAAHDPAAHDARHAFLVMAGIGFDADLMNDTSEEMKARVGWPAYVAGGMKNLRNARFHTKISLDGGEPADYRARTVLVGNCGKLTGGITLMPDAQVDDGLLDVVALTPKTMAGWAGVAAHVIAKREDNHPRLDRYKAQHIMVQVEEPQHVELDGDVIGLATKIVVTVQPKALMVRVDPIIGEISATPHS